MAVVVHKTDAECIAAVKAATIAVEKENSPSHVTALHKAIVEHRQHHRAKFVLRSGDERLVDDAFGLIPFVSGAFRENGARNFYMVSPFLQLITPKIDIKTGTWHFFTEKSLKRCTKAMRMCDLSWHDALNHYKLSDGGVEYYPLAKILDNIQHIEDKIINALNTHRIVIASNATETRKSIIAQTAKFYHNSSIDRQEYHSEILSGFIADSMKMRESKQKHPFEVINSSDNQPFLCVHDLKKFLDDGFLGIHLKESEKTKVLAQETRRIGSIIESIKAYKAMYEKLSTCIQGIAPTAPSTVHVTPTLTKVALAAALCDTKTLTDSDEKVIHEALDNLIQAILFERFELLSCHIHTYFCACVGTGTKVRSLAESFAKDAIRYCMSDFYRVGEKKLIILATGFVKSEPYSTWVKKMNDGKADSKDLGNEELQKRAKAAIIHSSVEWKSVFESIMVSVFDTFVPVDLSSSAADLHTLNNMISSGFTCRPTPEELTAGCFPYTAFNETSLNRLQSVSVSDNAINSRTYFQTTLDKSKKQNATIGLRNFCHDPVRDAGLDFINKKLTDSATPTHRYSYQTARKILYSNQCDNPSFVSTHLFDDVLSTSRDAYAKQYLIDISVPVVTGTVSVAEHTGLKLHDITWADMPFVNAELVLKLNHSALTQSTAPLTQSTTPKKKGNNKPDSRVSKTKKSTLKIWSGNGGAGGGVLKINKKAKKLKTAAPKNKK